MKASPYYYDAARLTDLWIDNWAVKYTDPYGRTWYAWAPDQGIVLFGLYPDDKDKIPQAVLNNAKQTDHTKVVGANPATDTSKNGMVWVTMQEMEEKANSYLP
jgi:hypothetical protein